MADVDYYRGGADLMPRPGELVVDPGTGLVLPIHGVSVESQPDRLGRFGGAYHITNLPPELRIVQVGRRRTHFEIIPVRPMPYDEYLAALGKIVLVPAQAP